jgi:hypothetical protein
MKHIIFGLLLSAIWGVSQAGSLVIDNTSRISFSGYDGRSTTVTGPENTGFLGSLAAPSTEILTATYLGNASGYVDAYRLGTGGALLDSHNLGASISKSVGAGLLSFSFSNNAGPAHTFWNGSQQQLPFVFAIMKGQTNKFGTFDYSLGFNDNFGGVADHDDFVIGASFANVAPVPEPRIYAMMLAGLGLIGFSVRSRKRQNFD